MVSDDPADTADKISDLPDDVLLDILGRLLKAGDVRTAASSGGATNMAPLLAASTSTLSRRWSHLPWPDVPDLSLDAGSFFADSDEWSPVKGRHRFWDHHRARAGFTAALARFLAAPPSRRVIKTLRLTFILTRRDYVRRIGDLVGAAADAGAVRAVELEIVTEMTCTAGADAPAMLAYAERFVELRNGCPGAFRRLTRLHLSNLWFEDEDALGDLVRGSGALESLALVFCGLLRRPGSPDDGVRLPAVLTVDAPRSRLKTLVCDECYIERVELVQAPALQDFRHRWFFDVLEDQQQPLISFGCTPSLRRLSLRHRPFPGEGVDVKWKLSELLEREGNQIETLRLEFENDKIWLQPEHPRPLRAALGGLKELHLREISPGYNLSWALFLLEASPRLESLDIHISDHICRGELRKKRDENTNLTWKPSPSFMHHNLKKLSFQRAFNVYMDMGFARFIMELAVNLETLTFGVKTLECKDCVEAEQKFPDPARSRLRLPGKNEHVDAIVKKLKDGISTSVQITIHLPD